MQAIIKKWRSELEDEWKGYLPHILNHIFYALHYFKLYFINNIK